MAAAAPHDRYRILDALLWASIGSAFIGSTCLSVAVIVEGSAFGIYERPWLALVAPLIFAAPSLFVVIPCTLVFGVPSGIAISHFRMRRWPALAVCLIAAIATQITCIWLVFWDEYSKPSDFLFTAPFALGAAVVLWWRLTRTA